MIKVELSFATPEECAEAMLRLSGVAEMPQSVPEPEPKEKPAKKTTRKSKQADPEPGGEPEPNITASPEDRKDPEQEAPVEMTPEEMKEAIQTKLRPALIKVMHEVGQDAARQFLMKFGDYGAKQLSDLPPASHDDFVKACEDKVAGKK